ncbi:DUF4303 domain-containing protein [uncultured Shewanella sp.]|uniref:DUF4303 domain-containing protein n=1 Tax=uncultured Shewanella sp. TaxID=173975 RepID=UPI00262394C8|nr:DUF4303 domain-containing protein [uncultured Shewanella sp.]
MSINDIEHEITVAARKCFLDLKCEENTNICGFALYSDPDAVTLNVAVNIESHLKEMQQDDPDDKDYYKWSPSEWKYEAVQPELFRDISYKLFEFSRNISTNDEHENFKKLVFESSVSALISLKNEGVFDFGIDDCVIVFSVLDSDDPTNEIEWIKKLNSTTNSNEFESWISTL